MSTKILVREYVDTSVGFVSFAFFILLSCVRFHFSVGFKNRQRNNRQHDEPLN